MLEPIATALAPGSATSPHDRLSQLLAVDAVRTAREYIEIAGLSDTLRDSSQDGKDSDWSRRDEAELNCMLKQYESIRMESLNTITNRIQTLVLGTTAIAALAGGGLAVPHPEDNRVLIHVIFSGAIPIVCSFVLLVWTTEATRSARAGYFLPADVESRINAKLGRLVMFWEAALWVERVPRDAMGGPSMIALALIGLLAGAAPWVGVNVASSPHLWAWIAAPYTLLLAVASYVGYLLKRLRNNPILKSVMLESHTSMPSSH